MPRLVACCAFLVAWSWIRAGVAGHPSPDHGWLPAPFDVLGAAAFVAVVLLAVQAHGVTAAAAGDRWRRTSAGALALTLLATPMLPLLSGDLFSVLAYAELALRRTVDPFTLPRPGLLASHLLPYVSPGWREAPCVYGPLQLLFWAPAARLAANLPAALAVAKLLAVTAVVATLLLLRRYCSQPGGPGLSAFAAVALSPLVWIEGAGQAHNDLVVALLIAGWLLAARRPGVVLPAALLGATVAAKLTAALPAVLYLAYLAGRPGSLPDRARRVLTATAVMGLVVAVAYAPYWVGADTLRVPLAYLAGRPPMNTLAEVAFVALRPLLGRPTAIAGLSALGAALTAGLALSGAVLAWRAPDLPRLAAAMAGVGLLAATVAAPVFHAWYLLPCLVLSVELRDPAWQRWLPRFAAVAILAEGSVLLRYGSAPRAVYETLAVLAVAGLGLHEIGPRLRGLAAPARRPAARAA